MRVAIFCIMADRTKHNTQRSFRFLAERGKTLANGTLAKRLVDKTSGLYVLRYSGYEENFRNNMDLHIS